MKMTPNNQRQGGKYNSNKEWEDEGKTGEEFQSADQMAYVSRPKTAIMDKMEHPAEPTPAPSEPENNKTEDVVDAPNPYTKVDWKKRHDDLKRHHDRKINSMKDEIAEVKQKMQEQRPTYTPPKSEEELSKFREENPEVYAVVESVSHLRANEQVESLKEELQEVKEQLQYEAASRAYAELKNLVPDFEEIKKDERFHEWADRQPQEIQDWVYKNSTNVQLAAKAINLYKTEMGIAPPKQEHRPPAPTPKENGTADEAVITTARREDPAATGKEKIWTRSEIAALSPAQAEKLMPELDKAFAEGRIVNG